MTKTRGLANDRPLGRNGRNKMDFPLLKIRGNYIERPQTPECDMMPHTAQPIAG
jgi:hypothetical protein